MKNRFPNGDRKSGKISKFKDVDRSGGRGRSGRFGGGGGGGGRGRSGGGDRGGGGGHYGGGHERRFGGFNSEHDAHNDGFNQNQNFSYNYPEKSDDRVFNEFKGMHDFNYVYETEPKKVELPQPIIPTVVSTPPPSFLEGLAASKELQTKSNSESSPLQSKSSGLEQATPTTPVSSTKKVKSEQTSENKSIKKEKEDAAVAELKKVKVEQKPPPSDSSSEEDSSSSSSEDEVPAMPKPLKNAVKTKKEAEDEVICLGKQINFQNLVDDDDSDEKPCLVCKTEGHSSDKCQVKCIKCSQSSYTTHVTCNNCGETYPPKIKSPNAPNPFLMFMQFMQFCMSQYTDISNEINQSIPGPPPVQGSTKEIEITRQDIADNKRHRKKSKSDTKQIRKKKKSEISTDSDSDSSSKATTSVKKRKKVDTPTPQVMQPPQQSKQIRKKKKSESSTDSDSDSSSKANVSVKKRKKSETVQSKPQAAQPIQQSKPIRKKKKCESSSDSDSDSSSKANASTKKRKTTDTSKPTQPIVLPKQQSVPNFAGAFPNNLPFAGGFSNPGYNPMLAFTQMMGYNTPTMNFPQ